MRFFDLGFLHRPDCGIADGSAAENQLEACLPTNHFNRKHMATPSAALQPLRNARTNAITQRRRL